MPPSPGSGRGRTRLALCAVLIAAPWLWFAVRGLGSDMDAVAVLLPLIGGSVFLALAALAALRRTWLPLLVGASVLGVAVVATVGPRVPQSSGAPRPPITLAMANVYDGNPTPVAAAAAMNARRVDVLATVEMTPAFWWSLQAHATLPYRVAVGQLGVESRWPLRLLAPHGLARSRLLRIGVRDPGDPFVLYVVHALNPLHDSSTFGDQRAFTRQVITTARAEPLPVVVVGDFNTSDRTLSYRWFTSAMRDAMRANTIPWSTYDGGWWATLFLRIDHAFIPKDWCAAHGSTFAVPGSDHHGIQVTVGPCV
jgi:endonuclease/exonuclease/phosphatase (EEP) superfamily protein YafD